MDVNNLHDLPEWIDDEDNVDEAGRGQWKPNATRAACKALYNKWNEILVMLNGTLGSMRELAEEEDKDDDLFLKDRKTMLLADAYEVGAKIRSSEAGGIYVLRMENASIIRKNAQAVKSYILYMMVEGEVDEEHGHIIRDEIDVFRDLFRFWVSTFEKDGFADDWGLFA